MLGIPPGLIVGVCVYLKHVSEDNFEDPILLDPAKQGDVRPRLVKISYAAHFGLVQGIWLV